MAENDSNDFGWKAALANFGYCSILLDFLCPLLIALCVIGLSRWKQIDSVVILQVSLETSMYILPVMLSILLAAYAFLLSIFFSTLGDAIQKIENGKQLLRDVNGSFAVCIRFIGLGTLSTVVIKYIFGMRIVLPDCIDIIITDCINLAGALLIITFTLYAIFMVKDITITLYNFGIASLKEKLK